MADRLVSVAVPVPALGLLTYRVPPDRPVPPAARVVVPLGSRQLTGVVLGEGTPLDAAIEVGICSRCSMTSRSSRRRCWRCAVGSPMHLAGPGAVLAAALPPHGLTTRVDAFKTVRWATLTAQGLDLRDRLVAPRCMGRAMPTCPGLAPGSARR